MEWLAPQNVIFAKKAPAAAGKTLTRFAKFQERHFGYKKARAAAGKTSPRLAKSEERHFGLKKGACSSREDLARANTCHKITGTPCQKKAPAAAAGKTSPG